MFSKRKVCTIAVAIVLLSGIIAGILIYRSVLDHDCIPFDKAVEIARETAHAEHDTDYFWIDDNYYELVEENDTAYMLAFRFVFSPDNSQDENIGGDYAPVYIIQKGTGTILWSGGGHDHWDGMMDEILSQN